MPHAHGPRPRRGDDLGLVPLAGLGLFRGDKLLTFVRQKLGGRTFADFVSESERDDPRYRYKLHIIATDLSRGRMLVLPDDLPSYGLNPNDFEVAEAVRMSMSAPFFFYASRLRWKNELDRVRESVVVDGGVLSNFPLELFDSPRGRRPRHPTLGFRIQDDGEYKIRGPLALAQKAWALVNTACSGNDMRAIARLDRQKAERTIKIPVSGVSAVNFWISDERKEQLYRSGQEAARTFLDGWDFERTSKSIGRTCGLRRTRTAGAPSRIAPSRIGPSRAAGAWRAPERLPRR